MVMSCGQQAGLNHNTVDNKSSERVQQVKCLGTTIKIVFRNKLRTDLIRQCLLSGGAEICLPVFCPKIYK